jgi:hypothetical protein
MVSAAQNRYDVLITEFLPDPTPSMGLPESEFIELKNRSAQDYNLRNWKISNGNTTATIRTNYILKADSFLILCSTTSVSSFESFGATLGVSGFPAINNTEGDIILSSDAGMVVHGIHYDKSWFENTLKAAGGWSLEMIDLSDPCSGKTNWRASVADPGGTPGKINSVDAENRDSNPPSLIRAIAADSLNVSLIFDEALDSASASVIANFFISEGIGEPEAATATAPFFNQVNIHLQNPLIRGKIYSVSVQQIRDCSGNEIGVRNHSKTGLAEKLHAGDIIFNEILFNPPPNGYDYLELYNRSERIINGSDLWISSRDAAGNIKDPAPLMKEARAVFPGEYLLISENPDWVIQNYPTADEGTMISFSSMPSMPDDLGKIVLLNGFGEVMDELDYDHRWHSPLLASESGVSLERIRADQPGNLASNWTSASASVGYGTPGYKNSESSTDSIRNQFITVDPKVFSPDMDGYQDFLFIHYSLPAAGFIGSISIYDIYGRMVRKPVDNILWGTQGIFRWDGLDEQQRLLPMGHYIIYVEVFRPDGTVMNQKLVCVLARKR